MRDSGIGLEITLLDDAVFSERPATAGAHAGLPFVPGSALLGAVAARLYPKLSPDDAWLAFHSGKVRFLPGVPVAENGQPAWPMPLAFHAEKEADWRDADGRMRPDCVVNLARSAPQALRQLREGFVTGDGLICLPRRRLDMKTAIDPHTGQAAEAQLFGYESLQAGQRFLARLAWDNDVPQPLIERILSVLTDATLHLGRSRSSQYGRATCRSLDASAPAERSGPTREIVIWALSDLALMRRGVPVFKPEPADFGIEAPGRLIAGRSFVRSRRWAPFNQARGARDVERQVVAAGSVFVFELDAEVDFASLPRSVGLFRECGLGCVAVNPVLLSGEHPVFAAPVPVAPQAAPDRPGHPLVDWMEAGARTGSERERAERDARRIVQAIQALYRALWKLEGEGGPSRSQWGHVREACAQLADDAGVEAIFAADGIIKPGDADWDREVPVGEGGVASFRRRLQEEVSRIDVRVQARALALAARAMIGFIEHSEAFDKEGRA